MDRKLLLFKWLMIMLPATALVVGHSLLGFAVGAPHGQTKSLLATLPVALLALGLSYLFAETMFRVLRRLQAEAFARKQDIHTMNAVMQERERLSRELHDGAAQLVAHLLLRLDTIKELVGADRRQEAEAELERLHAVADEIYEDIGESITGLRTTVTEQGLARALRDYVDQFEERYDVPVTLRTDAVADRLSPLAGFQLFRLVQEALTNVCKHADARKATVILAPDGPHRLQVVVIDDGRGLSAGNESHGAPRRLGLITMRERVEALGGTLEVSSQPGCGTRVTASIPMPETSREQPFAAVATAAG